MDDLSDAHKELAEITNPDGMKGDLKTAMAGADLFIGVSAPGIVSEEMIKSMAPDSMVFPMANPVPEIMPDLAKKAGARVVGTGRSDFANQISDMNKFYTEYEEIKKQLSERMNEWEELQINLEEAEKQC